MIRLRQHVPAFVNDGEGGWTLEAPDLATLLALPQVAGYARDTEPVERRGTVSASNGKGVWTEVEVIHPAPAEKRFHQWSLADEHLMVEHNNGDYWWVVGRIKADRPEELAALPKWKAGNLPPFKNPLPYRCAEHGDDWANCCLPNKHPPYVVSG